MYYDVGLSDWVFEIDEINGEQISSELKKLIDNNIIVSNKISNACNIIEKQYQTCYDTIGRNV